MNIIQISRGNLYKRYEKKVDEKYVDALKNGELFIQTLDPFSPEDKAEPKKGTALPLEDSVTHKKVYPQIGDLFIGTNDGYTQIGSSQNVIARFVLANKSDPENGKTFATVDLDHLGPSAIIDDDIIDRKTFIRRLTPNNIYAYAAESEFSKDWLIGIDGNPIKLHKKDVFLYLGKTYDGAEDDNDKTYKEVIIKLSGAGTAAEIEFPKTPEDDKTKANQLHSWFKAPNLVQSLYDIDKIKLSHYESERFEQFFGEEGSKDQSTGETVRESLIHEYPNLTKIRFITKTELLKRLVWLYTNEEPSEDLGFQVARIQGTEFKVWKSDDIKNEDGSTSENPSNYPIAVIDDCGKYSKEQIDKILGNQYEQTDKGFKLIGSIPNDFFIRDKYSNPVCLFYPGDEIIIKIRNTAANLDKYIEDHTNKENGAVYIDYSNSQSGSTAWQNADYHENAESYTPYDQVEITRRGALGNPNTNPGGNYPDGLPPDESPIDGPKPNSKYGPRANKIATEYWINEDGTLKTDVEAIKHLYHTKADVDINGKIFLSQLPQTVVGGMQRRSSIDNIKAFLTMLCKFNDEAKLNAIFNKDKNNDQFVQDLLTRGYEASFFKDLGDNDKIHLTEWAENANFLKRVVLSDKENDVALSKENRKLGDLIPSIDVGDYFIYTGDDISFEDLKEPNPDGFGDDVLTQSSKNNRNAIKFYYDAKDEDGNIQTKPDGSVEQGWFDIAFKKDGDEPKFRVGQFIKALLNDSAQKISGLHTGDIIVVDKIDAVKQGIRQGDEQDSIDTEDGYVTQISIIPSTSSSVSSLIVNGKEVTGAVELKGNERVHDNSSKVVETSIGLDGKKIIVKAENAVLMEGSNGSPIETEGTFYTLCKNKFAHLTNFKYNHTEDKKNWLSLSGIDNTNAVKWETKTTIRQTNVSSTEDDDGNRIYNVTSEPEKEVTTEHETASNEFFKFDSAAGNYGSLSLGIGVATTEDKDAHQIFQGKSGVIALLEDLYEALNFDPHVGKGDDGDDTDPEKLKAIAKELSHWHQRKHYYVVLDEEATAADNGTPHYKFKVEFENATLRDVVNDEKDPDAINGTVADKNFVRNWGPLNDDKQNKVTYQDGEKGKVKIDKTRAFQFYYEEDKKVSFVAATKTDQSTLLEGEGYNEIKEDVVQTIPLHSGVLLNSQSVIDCGEWV